MAFLPSLQTTNYVLTKSKQILLVSKVLIIHCLWCATNNLGFVFHQGIQTPQNNKSTQPAASRFHQFLGVWIPWWNTKPELLIYYLTVLYTCTLNWLKYHGSLYTRILCLPVTKLLLSCVSAGFVAGILQYLVKCVQTVEENLRGSKTLTMHGNIENKIHFKIKCIAVVL